MSSQERKNRHWFRVVAAIPMFLFGVISSVQAETYFSGMVGYTVAQDTTQGVVNNPQNVGLPAGTTIGNVSLNNSLMYGAKVGHYFNSIPWLGVELESYVTNPNRPAQQVNLYPPGGTFQQQEPGATNRVVVVSPNVVVRYQAGAFEPYMGIGPGVFFLHQQQLTGTGANYSQSSTGVGLNTQVGLRYRLTQHVSLFGEWKYNYAKIDLAGQADVNYFGINAVTQLHHFVFGLGYHF